MKHPLTWILISFTVFFVSCSEEPPLGVSAPLSLPSNHDFLQAWVHSYEEDSPSDPPTQIYRSNGSHVFPISHFRMQYAFRKDGTCDWLVLHPADAHYMEKATWKVDGENPNLVSIINPVGVEVVQFEILELGPDFMQIKPLKYRIPGCNYLYGKVDVSFQTEAMFQEVDAFAQGLGVEYSYRSRGEIQARADIVAGDPDDLKSRLEGDSKVRKILRGFRSYSEDPTDGQDFLIIRFVDDVGRDEVELFLQSVSELANVTIQKLQPRIRIDVAVGTEYAWVAILQKDPLVVQSRKAGSICP